MFISKKTAFGVLKEKKLSPSYEKFKADCYRKNWKERKGRVAVAAILDHFGLDKGQPHNKKKFAKLLTNEIEVMKFLNSPELDGIEIGSSERKCSNRSYEELPDLDVSMESTEEDSFLDVSMSSSKSVEVGVSELEKARVEIANLRSQNEMLKAERDMYREKVKELLQSQGEEKIGELFGKKSISTRENGSGRQATFKEPMFRLCLRSLAFGIPGRHLAFVLQAVADQLDLADESTPSERTLVRWREERLPVINERVLEKFIDDSQWIALMVDCSALRTPLKVSAIVLGSDTHECKLFDIIESEAKNGDQLADQIYRRISDHPLKEAIVSKLKHIQSDMGSSQKRANEILVRKFESAQERQGMPPVEIVYCGLHTVINGDARLNGYMMKECKKAAELHMFLKRLFGNRVHSSWNGTNLNRLLQVRLKKPSPFVTDLGGRLKVTSTNGRALLLNEAAVRETAFVSGSEMAENLQDIMEANDFPEILVQASIPWVLFSMCLSNLHGAFIGKSSYGCVKGVIDQSLQCLDEAVAPTSTMGTVISKLTRMLTDEDQVAAMNLQLAFIKVNAAGKKVLDKHLRGFISNLRKKLDKDVTLFRQLDVADDECLHWSNSRTESAFALLKFFDLKFSTMKLGNIIELSKAHFNEVTVFLDKNDATTTKPERIELVNRRKAEQRRLDATFVRSVYDIDFE